MILVHTTTAIMSPRAWTRQPRSEVGARRSLDHRGGRELAQTYHVRCHAFQRWHRIRVRMTIRARHRANIAIGSSHHRSARLRLAH